MAGQVTGSVRSADARKLPLGGRFEAVEAAARNVAVGVVTDRRRRSVSVAPSVRAVSRGLAGDGPCRPCHVAKRRLFFEGPKKPMASVASLAGTPATSSTSDDGAAFAAGFSGRETVGSVMTSMVVVANPDTVLGDILEQFAYYTGLPVVDPQSMQLVGIVVNIDLYKKQRGKADSVATSLVKDVMVSPVVAVFPHTLVSYAAGLMLKYKVHRLPVINQERMVVGIVTNEDLFQTLMVSEKPTSDSFIVVP